MLGAIIGDIAGSRFEFNNHRSKDFDLFAPNSFATDDSIMTLAIAKAIMEAVQEGSSDDQDFYDRLSELSVYYMQEIGRPYPGSGYGGRFLTWMYSDQPEPYNSFGNGSAMRVSPAGFYARSSEEALLLSDAVTRVTHNHPEGLKGARATAAAVFLARTGSSILEIKKHTEEHYYALDFTLDEIRPVYRFNETCQETVPQAIQCFIESVSFEDAIRNAISIGGDSDTIGAITGAIAQAYYGVPQDLRDQALTFLDERLMGIYQEWEEFMEEIEERTR